jgi:hypothetical protein
MASWLSFWNQRQRAANSAHTGGRLDSAWIPWSEGKLSRGFIDANADTVCLITGDQRAELEWLTHCDYLRALQRLGHETLARHDQRVLASPLALAVVSGLGTALTGGWTAALLILRGPARAAHALRPAPIAHG